MPAQELGRRSSNSSWTQDYRYQIPTPDFYPFKRLQSTQVVGFARRTDKIEALAKKLCRTKGKLHAVKVDISKEEDILAGFKWVSEKLGPVSILINNAGVLPNSTLVDGSTEEWKKVFDTNVMGLCVATREAVKIMKANKIDGHIIHINSVAGHKVPNIPNMNVYPASKHAVTALTETLRQELNSLGLKIRITVRGCRNV